MSDRGSSAVDALVSAGLYDPSAPEAAQRLELLEYLLSIDATVEEMVRADSEGRLFGLSGDRLTRPGRDTYTWTEVAQKAGMELEVLKKALRAYGIPYIGADTAFASDADVELLRGFAFFAGVSGEVGALGMARVLGSTMAKVAEAASQLVRGTTPNMQLENAPSPLVVAKTYEGVASQIPILGAQLETLFRHHLVIARRHFEASDSADIAGSHQMRLAVGFADLTGFTALSERLSPQALSHLLTEFETQVSQVVDHCGGRVVKFIGDEVMFVTATAPQAAEIAIHISRGAPPELPARVGVAYGACLATDGDYFGPPVNLASRLVDHAAPGEVLADPQLTAKLEVADGWIVTEQRAVAVRGISESLVVSVLDRSPVSVEAPLT